MTDESVKIDCWRIDEKIFECDITDDKNRERHKFTINGKTITSVFSGKRRDSTRAMDWFYGMMYQMNFGLKKVSKSPYFQNDFETYFAT